MIGLNYKINNRPGKPSFIGGGGGPFTPSSVYAEGDNGEWWDLNASGVTQDGVPSVTQFNGQRGVLDLPRVQVTGTEPILSTDEAFESVIFGAGVSNADRFRGTFSPVLTQGGTIMAAVKNTTADTARVFWTGGSASTRWQLSVNSGRDVVAFAGGSGIDSGLQAGFDWTVLTIYYNGASSYVRVNGVQTISGTMGTDSLGEFNVGGLWTGGNGINMRLASLLVIDKELTGSALTDAEGWMADRIQITI